MPELVTIPCLSDNYAFLLHDAKSGKTALIDAPEPGAIQAELDKRGWNLSEIWLTHHHWDHIDGVADLVAATGARVLGADADKHRLPPLDQALMPGTDFDFAGHRVEVLDVPGHTVGHIAFYVADATVAFTGDSLMAMGCGRLFEGRPDQMWDSLQRLMKLPADTKICSGHEYTAGNISFALTIESENEALRARREQVEAARARREPTVPSLLSDELATNPFLRAHLSSVKAALHKETASDAEVFAEIRARKDDF
ncbi:hydroxyacylglutathione hydrolase [Aliiroseovarius halocynthiae]|uniref:Hydroxyacylglutathione hydrolase n=1 Tax=Aliiroseovarius halocynthiae TaxID=985055 RepID=A0A545SYJ6_9RHOB|nr:hydroxyacylglutathione hydrolase [Aliiroseovarius halocynthiae]TQV70038.1 hydroxyacylglutathione hydrolase [Aliiroseovarius halocynthiae]SMR70708.1 hydroxyacylglutathione hydrolase [Aliiroseovarius halocynthiae]